MAVRSGITLINTDPALIPTPDPDKATIFMDASLSPPFPAFKDDSGIVQSLQGPQGPAGPAGGGTVDVQTFGALSGDGSSGTPLGVNVDNETIGVDSANKLQVIAPYISTHAPRHALQYSGGYLDVCYDNET